MKYVSSQNTYVARISSKILYIYIVKNSKNHYLNNSLLKKNERGEHPKNE